MLLSAALLCAAPLAPASPSFTRQTGAACKVCHYKDMRSLNAYGREFLRNSFHESKKMAGERRELEQKARQENGNPDIEYRDIEGPDRSPIEERNGHQDDQGTVEDRGNVEMAETLERGAIEEQEKNAP